VLLGVLPQGCPFFAFVAADATCKTRWPF